MTDRQPTKPKCTDCGKTCYSSTDAYKLRRNREKRHWEPICTDCWKKLVIRQGGVYGALTADIEDAKLCTVCNGSGMQPVKLRGHPCGSPCKKCKGLGVFICQV